MVLEVHCLPAADKNTSSVINPYSFPAQEGLSDLTHRNYKSKEKNSYRKMTNEYNYGWRGCHGTHCLPGFGQIGRGEVATTLAGLLSSLGLLAADIELG
jgi:hypothetical protein